MLTNRSHVAFSDMTENEARADFAYQDECPLQKPEHGGEECMKTLADNHLSARRFHNPNKLSEYASAKCRKMT
jgi:hypothetical protein